MKPGIVTALALAALTAACSQSAQRGGGAASQPVIRPTAQASAQPLAAPRVVYVADFAIDPSMVRTASDVPSQIISRRPLLSQLRESAGAIRPTDSTNPATEARQAVNQLAESLVNGLNRAGVQAQRLPAGSAAPADAWVVRGRFDTLSEGNRVQESMVGFGAGEPQVEVSGNINATEQGSPVTILTFGDEAQTHRMPGSAVTRNPYAMAAKFVLSRGATSRDVDQLGSSLAGEIVSYMRANGLAR